MTATSSKMAKSTASRKERPNEGRRNASRKPSSAQNQQQPRIQEPNPAAGAHAASHLVNEDATPGAGVLPSRAHASGKEVDGGAG